MQVKNNNNNNKAIGEIGNETRHTLNGQELQSPPDRRRVSGILPNQDL